MGRFENGFGRPKSWFGNQKLPKRGWKPPKNRCKIKVKENIEKNIQNENEVADFEFNQDVEFESEIKSPGWLRYQKRLK